MGRNSHYEAALTKQGVQWQYVDRLELDEIDAAKSLRNQARLDMPLDEELVESYRSSYKAGDDFPPLVVWRTSSRAKYLLIDGNQRYAAATKAGRKTLDVYAVECTDEMVINRITWSFNNIVNGKRLSEEEALKHAVTWVRKYGRDAKEAAKEWGVPYWKVNRKAKTEEIHAVLNAHNIQHVDRITDDIASKIAPLMAAGEDVLALGATVITYNGLSNTEVAAMMSEAQRARTSQGKMEVLANYNQRPEVVNRRAETKGGTIKVTRPDHRTRFRSLLLQLRNLLEDHGRAVRPPAGEAFTEVQDVAGDVIDRLRVLFGLGNR